MSTNQKSSGIGRREFLVLTGATTVATLALGERVLRAQNEDQPDVTQVSIGYASPDALEKAEEAFVSNVVPASRIPSSDGTFIRTGVRVAVRGAHLDPRPGRGHERLDLVTEFTLPADSCRGAALFGAWSYRKSSSMISSPVSFRVPVDHDQRVSMAFIAFDEKARDIDRRRIASTDPGGCFAEGVSGRSLYAPVVLTLGSDDNPKLRRGYYIVAPLEPGAAQPRWSALQLRNDTGYRLYEGRGGDAVPAEFEYVVLFIDYDTTDEQGRRKSSTR
jgi:hypothetical protein